MIWDYRLIKIKKKGVDYYQVHRVMYQDPLRERAVFIERKPTTIEGRDLKEMLEVIELMVNAFDSPYIYMPGWNEE